MILQMDMPIGKSRPLPFFQLEPIPFQQLCRDLFRKLDGVRGSRIYGSNGQAQKGIDVLVSLDGDEFWGVQCKACEKNEGRHLKKAVEEFKRYVDEWKKRGMTRFYVVLGCPVEDTKASDSILVYESEFSALGLKFEAWDSHELREQLRNKRSVVEQHLGPPFVDLICGSQPMQVSAGFSGSAIDVPSFFIAMQSEVSDLQHERVEQILEETRRGKEAEAEAKIEKLRVSATWSMISPHDRSRILKILAQIILGRRGDVSVAQSLVEDAKRIEPSISIRFVEASIIQRQKGAEAALDYLSEPTCRDDLHMKAALLLSLVRLDEACALFNGNEYGSDTETTRLQSVVALAQKQPQKAKSLALKAFEERPDWILVRSTLAMVEYFSSVCAAFPGWLHWPFPLPPPWQYVRSTKESRDSLAHAASMFEAIASQGESDVDSWVAVSGWRLACLGNDSARQEEAIGLAKEILSQKPIDPAAILWTLSRGWEISLDGSRRELERICATDNPSREAVETLFVILIAAGDNRECLKLLGKHENLYTGEDDRALWRRHKAQVLAYLGEASAARELLEITDGKAASPNLIITRKVSNGEVCTPSEANVLGEAYENDRSLASLFYACAAQFESGNPKYVMDHADDLLTGLDTENTLMLVLRAADATNQPAAALSYSEQYRRVFRDGDYSPIVRRMRIQWLIQRGKRLQAISELKVLSDDELTAEDRFIRFDLLYNTGNTKAALSEAQFLLSVPDASGDILVGVADRIRAEDPALTRRILNEASRKGVSSPEVAATASRLCLEVGDDRTISSFLPIASPIFHKEGSPLRAITIEELVQLQNKAKMAAQDAATRFREGNLPVHLFAEATNRTLASLINPTDESPRFSIGIRQGGKAVELLKKGECPQCIILDITSVYLCARLDLFDWLVNHTPRLQISSKLIDAINTEIRAHSSMPEVRASAWDAILNMVRQVRIHVWDGESDVQEKKVHDQSSGSPQVKWRIHAVVPPAKEAASIVQPTPCDEYRACDLLSLASILQRRGLVSRVKIDQLINSLPTHAPDLAVDIPDGTRILFDDGVAEILETNHLLSDLAGVFQVYLSKQEVAGFESALITAKKEQSTVDWLRSLREKIAENLSSGRIELLEITTIQPRNDRLSLETQSLWQILQNGRKANTWLCVEDRFLQRVDLSPAKVVGIVELLLLRFDSTNDADALYSAINNLRAADFRFVDLLPGEILHHLSAASIKDGRIVETAELADIRRYFAKCLLDVPQSFLRVARKQDILKSEWTFIYRFYRSVTDVLLEIWCDLDAEIKTIIAYSEWILDALWLDPAGLGLLGNPAYNTDENTLTYSESVLYDHGLGIILKIKDPFIRDKRCTDYLLWVASRIGNSRTRLRRISPTIKEYMLSFIQKKQKPEVKRVVQIYLNHFFNSLPPDIRERIEFAPSEQKKLGWRNTFSVSVGNHSFEPSILWPAAARAINGDPSSVCSLDQHTFHITASSEGNSITLSFVTEDENERFNTSAKILPLLIQDQSARKSEVMNLRKTFDLSVIKDGDVLQKLSSTSDPVRRMSQAYKLLDGSFCFQLRQIKEELREEHRFNVLQARPKGRNPVLHHLRLPAGKWREAFPCLLEKSAKVLLADEGFMEAFIRLACLPVPLPTSIRDAFKGLPSDKEEMFRKHLHQKEHTPVILLHATTLFLGGNQAQQEFGIECLNRLTAPSYTNTWAVFTAFLQWADCWMLSCDSEHDVAPAKRLASIWIHAVRVHELIADTTDPEGFASFIRGDTQKDSIRLDDQLDVSSAWRTNLKRLVMGGLAVGLSPDTSPSVKEKIREKLDPFVFNPNNQGLPDLTLLQQNTGFSNALGSYLKIEDGGKLSEVMDEAKLMWISDGGIAVQIRGTLGKNIEPSDTLTRWVYLNVLLGDAPPTIDQLPLVVAEIGRMSFSDLSSGGFERLSLLAHAYFAQCYYCREFVSADASEHKLLELSGAMLESPGEFTVGNVATVICNCAFILSLRESSEENRFARFASTIERIASSFPALASSLVGSLSYFSLKTEARVRIRGLKDITSLRSQAKRLSYA